MLYQKEIPEKEPVDVLVAGGGPAGIAAAIAAARMGKKVLLAEATGCFGGLGTAGLVPAFAPFDNGVELLCAGIGFEIRRQISQDIPLNSYWTPIHAEELKRVYDKMLLNAGVQLALFTRVVDTAVDGRRITSAILHGKSGLYAVPACVFVDATGDGDLCATSGGQWEMGDENGNVMPVTLCSEWADIHGERIDSPQNAGIEQAWRDGILSAPDRHLPGIQLRKNGSGGGNVGHIFGCNPIRDASLTQSIMQGRAQLAEYEQYYRRYLPGYEEVKLCATADLLGVRESRRIRCDYMLTIKDFLTRANFADEIGRYAYRVDIHRKTDDSKDFAEFEQEYQSLRCQKGESYGIPYRSLIPVSFDNVLVAGRCMGADRFMQSALRVMPGCFITGQAAGTAAALAADGVNGGHVRAVAYADLANALRSAGAYVPSHDAK